LHTCILTSWHAFDKYYLKTDDVVAYGTALLLAPYRRLAYLQRNWKPSWIQAAKAAAQQLWEQQYKGKYDMDGAIEGRAEGATEMIEEPDEYDKFDQEQALLNGFHDELDHYIKSAPIQL
jgi:hypothetical protein